MGREFKMIVELGSYEMDDIMLDLRSDVNIFPTNLGILWVNQTWYGALFNAGFPINIESILLAS
jgi:hypothetical protein